MESVLEWIREWDFFAVPVRLNYKGQKAFNTTIGGCCTLTFLIGFFVYFVT